MATSSMCRGLLDKSPSDAPLVSLRPHGLKCDECYMSSALVSPHDFKNDGYFIIARLFRLMAWGTTNVTCVARLFRVMA